MAADGGGQKRVFQMFQMYVFGTWCHFWQGFSKISMKEIHFADIFCTNLSVFVHDCLPIQHQTGRNKWQEKQTGNTDDLLCEELSWVVVYGLSKC